MPISEPETSLQSQSASEVISSKCEFCEALRDACLCGFQYKRYPTVQSLKTEIEIYVKGALEEHRPLTLTGLAILLGVSRKSLVNFKKRGSEWAQTIDLARSFIEEFAESALYDKGKPVAGAIFALTNNHGWSNKQEFTFAEQQVFGPLILLPEKKPEGAPGLQTPIDVPVVKDGA